MVQRWGSCKSQRLFVPPMLTITMLVGLGVTGVMMLMFTTENFKTYAVLNAMGATSRSLLGAILVQAGLCALSGTGLGLGVCAIAGRIFGAYDFPAGGRTRRRTRSRCSVSRRPRSACRPSYGRTEWRGGEFRSMKAAWERRTRAGAAVSRDLPAGSKPLRKLLWKSRSAGRCFDNLTICQRGFRPACQNAEIVQPA